MKLSKKTLVTVFLLTVCFTAAFAQTPPHVELMRLSPKSMTNESTKELFGTDVDDYLDVNEWSNVKPEKLFGFLSYGKSGADKLNFGLAGPVAGKFYLSGFFGGQLNSWTSKKETEKNGKDKNKTTTGTSTTNKASGSLLFGFDNIGIMGSFTYQPRANNGTVTNKLTKTTNTKNKFNLEVALKAGMNITGSENKIFKASAELGLTSKVDKEITKTTGSSPSYTLANGSEYTLRLNGGVGFDFAHNGPVTQGASFALNTEWNIYPIVTSENSSTNTKVKTYGKLSDTLTLDPAWQITYEPEGNKVALKAKVNVPVAFHFDNDENYTDTIISGSPTKVYKVDRKYTTKIGFTPALSVGLTYAPISKFRFNLGAKFKVPTFGWTIETTKHRNSSDGSLTAAGTDKDVTWDFKTADGKIELGTGFTWLISQNITFDARWNLGNLLDNFKIDFSSGNIWDKLGQFIGNDIGFLLSVKL